MNSISAAAVLFLLPTGLALIAPSVVYLTLQLYIISLLPQHRTPLRRRQFCVALLDPADLSVAISVKFLRQHALIDILRRRDENIFHAVGVQGRSLEKLEAILLGKSSALLVGNLSFVLEVRLVAHEHYDDLGVAVLLDVLQPLDTVLEAASPCDVVREEAADGAAIVRPGNGSERLLPCRVPHLQLHVDAVVDRHEARAKLHPDRQVVGCLEAAVCEAQEEAGLSDSRISHYDKFQGIHKRHFGTLI